MNKKRFYVRGLNNKKFIFIGYYSEPNSHWSIDLSLSEYEATYFYTKKQAQKEINKWLEDREYYWNNIVNSNNSLGFTKYSIERIKEELEALRAAQICRI